MSKSAKCVNMLVVMSILFYLTGCATMPRPQCVAMGEGPIDVSGEWMSNYGPVWLTQRDHHVTGQYYDNRKGRLEGTLLGNALSFSWDEGSRGVGKFVFCPDNSSFDGSYSGNYAWYGTRIGMPPPPLQAKLAPTMPAASAPLQRVEPSVTRSSDVDTLPGITTKPNKNAYAIVIGIEQYRQKLPKADFAVSDAKLVSEYLTKTMGYPEENVVTLTNEQASLGDFVKYFEKWLPNNAEQGSTVFVYYSGHGAPNPKSGDAYLVPYDGDPSFIEQTGYSLKRVYENLAKLPAKNIIVALDSCFSGAGGKSVAAKGSRALVRVEKTSARNVAVLTASMDDQTSSSYEDKGHGVFTYFFLKGIKEMLGEDKNSRLELGELYNYLKPQVERTSRRLYNNEQTPQLMTADEQMKKIGLR